MLNAPTTCWGTHPLPHALSCPARVRPIAGAVTQPAGQPIIHSVNSGFRRWLPFFPSGSVGAGAGRVSDSHWRTAGSYSPQLTASSRVGNRCLISRSCGANCAPSRSFGPPVPSETMGVGRSVRGASARPPATVDARPPAACRDAASHRASNRTPRA